MSIVNLVHFQANIEESECITVFLHDKCNLTNVLDREDGRRLRKGNLKQLFVGGVCLEVVVFDWRW